MVYSNGPSIVRDGLVLYLDAADRNSYSGSGSVWNDLSGNSNNSTINGAAFDTYSKGMFDFNGSSNYTSISSTVDLAPRTGDFTFCSWINPDNWPGTWAPLFVIGSYGGLWIGKANTNYFVLRAYAIANYIEHTLPITGKWSHIAITREGTSVKLYYDSVLVSSATTSQDFIQSTAYIGTDGAVSYFNGKIANISFYKGKALSPDEVKQNYYATKARFNIPTDLDTIDYISRVAAADGSTLEPGVILAIDQFIQGCKKDNVWDLITSSCILCGAKTLAGALVPLKGNSITNNGFEESDYNRKTGLTGLSNNTKYLDTNTSDTSVPLNDVHMYARISALPTSLNSQFVVSGDLSETGNSSLMLQQYNTYFYTYNRGRVNEYIGIGAGQTGDFALWRSNQYNAITAKNSTVQTNGKGSNPSLGDNVLIRPSDGRMQFFSFGTSLNSQTNYDLLRARVANLIAAIDIAI